MNCYRPSAEQSLITCPLPFSLAAGKVQESYCYQIFLDQNHSLVLPTVQQLLEHSFHSAGLKLVEVRPPGFLLHSSYTVTLTYNRHVTTISSDIKLYELLILLQIIF